MSIYEIMSNIVSGFISFLLDMCKTLLVVAIIAIGGVLLLGGLFMISACLSVCYYGSIWKFVLLSLLGLVMFAGGLFVAEFINIS